jgi:hypothetical protein
MKLYEWVYLFLLIIKIKEMKKILLIMIAFVFVNNINAQLLSQSKMQKTQKCNPWRNVTGYNSLCKELNSFNCAKIMCPGTSKTTVLNNFLLQNTNNSNYIFSSNQVVSVTIQNEMITQATNWANANKPANYSIEGISFIADIVTAPGITYAGIDIKVTYKLCDNNTALPN